MLGIARPVVFLALTVVVCQNAFSQAATDRIVAEDAWDQVFTLEVFPLLRTKCFGCHADDPSDLKGDFGMATRDDLVAGGESGDAALVPGNAEDSPLYQAVAWDGLEMPPKENDRLTEAQVALVRQWIDAGAVWPDEETQQAIRQAASRVVENEQGVLVTTSGGTSEEWTLRRYEPEDLWGFRPVSAEPPARGLLGESGHPVDFFVDQKLMDASIGPAALASPTELIRRASFDLIGMPPTPEEVSEFVAAHQQDSESAWLALIDRLLASPHYGERWGQHWLDITRYADTGGMSNDYERSNMWRYRDYVIRAFNEDKRYDEFVIEQIAGDELADESVRQRIGDDAAKVHRVRLDGKYTPAEAEQIIATGFLRLGPWDNAMVSTEEARQIYLDDVVNHVGQTFLATAMRCCKCHDHKFDPIPTRDYYRMYSAFSTTHAVERPVPFLDVESREGFEEGKADVERLLAFAVKERDRLIAKREAAARAWFDEHGLPYKNEAERRDLPDEEKPIRHVGLSHVEQGQLKVREQDAWIWTRRLERYQPMVQGVYNDAGVKMQWNGARKLRMNKKVAASGGEKNYILTGGALDAQGDEVQPGVLSGIGVPASEHAADPYRLTENVDGRRLQFARWVANEENPLTTRAIVNRIWQHHFGKGIAGNPNNFGGKGAKPTHLELLDFLADDFVKQGWKIKRMHRLIMTSHAYQRSTRHPDRESLMVSDPDNQWLAHFPARRLTAEEVRDSLLRLTGEWNPRQGGLPAMPEINLEVALQPRMIQFSLAPAYQPSRSPQERNRRSIYAYRVRGQADPFLEIFNQPGPNESCECRDTAAVTPQAFTLLNSDLMSDRSIAMALRLEGRSSEIEAQIRDAFGSIFNRQPNGRELSRLSEYVRDMRQYHAEVQPAKTTYPTELDRSLVEEFTGKVFHYREILPRFEDYIPDPKPADVSASTRALADLCLLLFNTNEFMYLR